MSEDTDNKFNVSKQIGIAILVAVAAGGSLPWWWMDLKSMLGFDNSVDNENAELVISILDSWHWMYPDLEEESLHGSAADFRYSSVYYPTTKILKVSVESARYTISNNVGARSNDVFHIELDKIETVSEYFSKNETGRCPLFHIRF